MTTELQIRANRQNAQHSTGPKTEEGKRRVAVNPILHGLRAKTVVLPGEDRRAFEELRVSINLIFHPVGNAETFMAERAAVALWRLHRVLAQEGRLLAARQALQAEETPEQAFQREIALLSQGLPGLSSYEARLEANFNKATADLRQAQEVRAHREARARGDGSARKHPKPTGGMWANQERRVTGWMNALANEGPETP